MTYSMPCLKEVTVGSKLSDVAAQQLSVLSAAKHLRVLVIPQGQSLRDRSLMVSGADYLLGCMFLVLT